MLAGSITDNEHHKTNLLILGAALVLVLVVAAVDVLDGAVGAVVGRALVPAGGLARLGVLVMALVAVLGVALGLELVVTLLGDENISQGRKKSELNTWS
jgi:hypothetical protein